MDVTDVADATNETDVPGVTDEIDVDRGNGYNYS